MTARRRRLVLAAIAATALLAVVLALPGRRPAPIPDPVEIPPETVAGWTKATANPVFGPGLGTVFDVALLQEEGRTRMWFSWRTEHAIGLTESADGVHWTAPRIVLRPDPATGWEDDVNRPAVLRRPDGYHMWYTGQVRGQSAIGHAVSPDGVAWTRTGARPVLTATAPGEKRSVMCPDVLWDDASGQYRLWYSGGDQFEPDAIGAATSPDGVVWTKLPAPVFTPAPDHPWEAAKVTAGQIVRVDDWYVLFYIGFQDVFHARIGLARSRDGLTNWARHPANPILRRGPSAGAWDRDGVYKPFALVDATGWRLWYNGRRDTAEAIGLAQHPGRDLGFDD